MRKVRSCRYGTASTLPVENFTHESSSLHQPAMICVGNSASTALCQRAGRLGKPARATCVKTTKRARRRGVGASAARGVEVRPFAVDRPPRTLDPLVAAAGPLPCRHVHDMFQAGPVARRFETIEHLAWRGLWLRRWCFTCDRGSSIDAGKALQLFLDRGWSFDLQSGRQRYPCKVCRSSENVLLLPASPPPPPPLPRAEPEKTWAQVTEAFFHSMWAAKRKDRRR